MKCSDISVGEYVRNKYGYIGKYKKNSNGIYEIKIRNGLVCRINSKEEIIKHSKDIIDLIEKNDYVNGEKINEKFYDYANEEYHLVTKANKHYFQDDIELIVTKEQIKQIEYRIKE